MQRGPLVLTLGPKTISHKTLGHKTMSPKSLGSKKTWQFFGDLNSGLKRTTLQTAKGEVSGCAAQGGRGSGVRGWRTLWTANTLVCNLAASLLPFLSYHHVYRASHAY